MARHSAELQHCLRAVESLVRSGDTAHAAKAAAESVAKGFEHTNLFILAAYFHIAQGNSDLGLACATRAADLDPTNSDALNVRGLALAHLGRLREAISMYDASLERARAAPHIHFNKGKALEDLNENRAAKAEYERTVALQPGHSDALARLASLSALAGEFAGARRFAASALRFDPQNHAASIALAMADLAEEKFESAMARLEPLMENPRLGTVNKSIAQGLVGDALNGIGNQAAAFAAWQTSNDALRQFYHHTYQPVGVETAFDRVQRLITYFRAEGGNSWSNSGYIPSVSGLRHAFLVGFPRSGTTLLEQILDSHPDVETLEERDCLADAVEDFILTSDGLDLLASIEEEGLRPYRESYWKAAALHGISRKRGVFVDKLPLNSVLLCLIAKLFPDAMIVFAVRDPRDVVLSCFRRRFSMTPQMYELLTLEGAANYYSSVMTLSKIYKDKLALPTHTLRYEDMIENFDAEVHRLLDFLDLDWHDSVRNFAEIARNKEINTPSAAQVTRGLYTQGIGQWRKYRLQLAPALPALAPWIAQFGYSED